MKKTITLFLALALVSSLFAVPLNPKHKQGKQKAQTEQQVEQPSFTHRADMAVRHAAQMNIARPVAHKAAAKKSVTIKKIHNAVNAPAASTEIQGIQYGDAYYYEYEGSNYWDIDLYKDYDYDEGAYTYPELYVSIAANSKTAIAGEAELYYAGLWTSENDSIEFANGALTITYDASAGTYGFEGDFEDASGNSYTISVEGVEVYAYDADNDYEEIELKEGGGSTLYEIDFTAGQGDWTINNVTLPSQLTFVWKQDNTYGMKASAFKSSTAYAAESWLISPSIDLSEATSATLTLNQALNKAASTNLRVKVSTNGGTTWTDLAIGFPAGTSWDFQNDTANLNAYVGQTIQLALVYISTTSVCPTWEIKTLSIAGEGSSPTSKVDTIVVPVNYVEATRYDSYSEAGSYLWQVDALNYTSSSQYESVWFDIVTTQNNRLEGIYDIESDNIYNFYGVYYYAGFTTVNGTDTTDVAAGTENIQLTIAYDETNKAYDLFGELLSEDGKKLYQFEVEDFDIFAYNEDNEEVVLVDSTEFVPDTIAIKGQNAIEFAYYASYSEEGSFNYSVNLYHSTNVYPYLALDLYAATKGNLVGTYNETAGNLGEYSSCYLDEETELGISNLNVEITANMGIHKVTGSFTGSDMNVYTFKVSAFATEADGDYPYEPMEKQEDISVTANSKDLNTEYVSDYNELYLFLYSETDTIQLDLYTSKTAISDGTYALTTEEEPAEGDMVAGYYGYYGPDGSVAYIGEELYYLTDGTLEVATVGDTTTYTLTALSAHGTSISAVYQFVKAGPTPGGYTIVLKDYCTAETDTAFTTSDGQYSIVARKAKANNKPLYNTTSFDLRNYAGGTFEISSTSTMTELVFNLSAKGKEQLAELTTTAGSVVLYDATDEGIVRWTGSAKKVVFTVGDSNEYGTKTSKTSGQFDFTSINVYTATGLNQTAATKAKATKVVMNGQFYILNNGVLYNAQGQVIK